MSARVHQQDGRQVLHERVEVLHVLPGVSVGLRELHQDHLTVHADGLEQRVHDGGKDVEGERVESWNERLPHLPQKSSRFSYCLSSLSGTPMTLVSASTRTSSSSSLSFPSSKAKAACEASPSPTSLGVSPGKHLNESQREVFPVLVTMDDVSVLEDDGEIISSSPLPEPTGELHVPVPVAHDDHVDRAELGMVEGGAHGGPRQLGPVRLDLRVVGRHDDVALQHQHVVDHRAEVLVADGARQRLRDRERKKLPRRRRAARCSACRGACVESLRCC